MAFFPTRARHFAPRRTGDASPLGDLENAVMGVVWAAADRISVADVHAALAPARQPEGAAAYTTFKTTMERLVSKGILSRAREGKAYYYSAAVSREELERRIVTQVLGNLVRDFPSGVASFFVHPDTGLTEEHLNLLMRAVDATRLPGEPDA